MDGEDPGPLRLNSLPESKAVLWFARLVTPALVSTLLGMILWALNNIHVENVEYRTKVDARLEVSDSKLEKLQRSQDELSTKVNTQLSLFQQLIDITIKNRTDDINQIRAQIADHETRVRNMEHRGR